MLKLSQNPQNSLKISLKPFKKLRLKLLNQLSLLSKVKDPLKSKMLLLNMLEL
jgi:hypothetical protein